MSGSDCTDIAMCAADHVHPLINAPTVDMLGAIFPSLTRDGDIRLQMLAGVMVALQARQTVSQLATCTTPELVAFLVDAVRHCHFPHEHYQRFKAMSLEESQAAFRCYAESICDVLANLTPGGDVPIQIVSLGCGGGDIERFVDAAVRESVLLPQTAPTIHWVGVDRTPPDRRSFFLTPGNRFVATDMARGHRYLDLAEVPPNQWQCTLLIASYAVHHLDLPLEEFLRRCEGAAGIILLEELTTGREWAEWTHRAARIGFDLLSNIGFNPAWAQVFLEDPAQFRVRYLCREEIASRAGQVIDVPHCSPPMSVVIF